MASVTKKVTLRERQREARVVTCTCGENEAASLSLTRDSLDEARDDLRSQINATPEFKRALIQRVLAMDRGLPQPSDAIMLIVVDDAGDNAS
jgi:hypothetical protein